MQGAEKRIIWMDLLRVFSILAVIFLHTAASGFNQPVDGFNFQVANVYNSLSRFCVPVFVMISGAMFLNPLKEITAKKLYLKYIPRILAALIFWSTAYSLYDMLDQKKAFNLANIKELIKDIMAADNHLWFLFVLLGLYMLTPILRAITANDNAMKWFLAFGIFFVSLLPFIYAFIHVPKPIKDMIPKLLMDKTVAGYPIYFIAGYFLSKIKLKRWQKYFIYLLGIAASLTIIIHTSINSIDFGSPKTDFYYYFSFPCAVQAIAVFTFFKEEISRINFSVGWKKTILLFSGCSFGIYLVHVFFSILFANIGFTVVLFNPIFNIPARALLNFTLSFCVAFLIGKIPIAKKYLM